MKKLFLLSVLMILPLMASAEEIEINGIKYNLIEKGKLAEVVRKYYQGSVVIPEKVSYNGTLFTVTSIGEKAFYYCDKLTSITIPQTITSMGSYAFLGTNLSEVHISNLEAWCKIKFPGYTYNPLNEAGHLYINGKEVKDLVIPDGITSLEGSFGGCSSLTSVTIPNSVTNIGFGTFYDCKGLTSIDIPSSVTTLGDQVFRKCTGLTSVIVPNSVTSFGEYAFEQCSKLSSVVIGDGVTEIKYRTFQDCSNLKTVTIGKGIKYIKNWAFQGCKELTEVYCYSKTVPSVASDCFNNAYIEYATLHVPKKSVEKYKQANIWNSFGNILPIDMPEYTLRYLVDGEVYKEYTYEEDDDITPEPAPTKEGYTFSGWSDIPSTMPAHDVTVTGTFTVNKYKLIYKVDGAEYKIYEVAFGATITPEAEPKKEGYAFSGWSEIPETMPAHDVTVTGSFTINKYKLIYKVAGADYKTYELEYGATITPEPAPTKEGYTFSGWSEIPETMPARDVTVTGSFTVNKYKLIYKVDDVEYKSYDVEYGATITPEAVPTKEGYTFSGWGEIPKTMPANDVIVTGTFTINKYKLTYKVDGVEYKTYEMEYGASITPEAEPTKEGYTFSGWSWIPSKMPAENVTVSGTFTINKYKLTYFVDGSEYKSYEIEYGTKITQEPAPTKEGYTFSGWSEIPATMPAKDVTVTGTFTINKYKLTYMVDGVEYKLYQIEYGTKITPEAEPTKEGYSFSGWSSIPETMPANDVVVTGTFTKGAYKLTYMVDGQVYKTVSYDYGAAITPEPAPTKEGYTFSGWSNIPTTMPANDVTVTGTFTINKYKLTYMVDGVEYKSYQIEYGAKITPEAEPTKEGHSFSGWSSIPEIMPAKDVIVTGTFTKGAYKLTYIVDGQVYKTVSYDYGATITPEAAPTKEGYTFSGWSEIPKTMPAKDVIVTGSFTINKYKLTYIIDNVEYKSYEIEYGVSITPESAPTKEGYTFSGWSEIPQSMPAKDVIVTGTFTINTYKLTYMVDGTEYKSYDIEYGATITSEAEPTKEGYTFSGWNEIPETMPAGNVTIIGSFTVNKYMLTYIIDGEVYKTYEVEYGANITPEAAPEKEGYDFSGWDYVPETMPAHDVTVTATFTLGISDALMDSEDVKFFDTQGNQIGKLKKGINIIVYKNGERKKVVIK